METKKSCSTANATILACQKIAQTFYENIFELSLVREDWNVDFASNLHARIIAAKATHLLSESFCSHTSKQQHVHEIMFASLKDVSVVRALVRVDFKEDKKFQKTVFEKLGYNTYFSDAKNGDTHSLYMLLQAFKKNLSQEIINKLIGSSISEMLIDRICSYADQIKEFQSCFDLINHSTLLTKEGKKEVQEIFTIIKDICRVATAYYMFDPLKRDQFCFFRVMINLRKPTPILN
ncbi:hypothetical protein ACUNWD_16635 [Sunxiuqinia sp. A32]|uniref:hypothetical protein n=1 Tax=Sunxiuqinia sp. A32 TaxID=3461496 RepID=UPI00404636DD